MLLLSLEGALASTAWGQSLSAPITDPPKPVLSQNQLGYVDASALSTFSLFRVAIGLNTWVPLTVSGTTAFGTRPTQFSTVLQILPERESDLNIERPEGHDVLHFGHESGYVNYAGGRMHSATSSFNAAGAVALDLPFAALTTPSKYIVTDRGEIAASDHAYRRITVEIALENAPLPDAPARVPIDLYFDEQSHLLVESVSLVSLPENPRATFKRVLSYTGYESFGAYTFPKTIIDRLDGRTMSTLTITSVANN